MLLSTAFSLLQPWPITILVDHVLGQLPMPAALATVLDWLPGAQHRSGLLAWVVLSGLLIFVVDAVLDVALTLTWTRVGRRTVYDLAGDLFAEIQRRSLVFHSRRPVGVSLSRITGDAWCVYTVVDTLLFTPGHAVVTLVAMLAIMAALDPFLTVLAVMVAPFMAGSAWVFGKPLRRAAHAATDAQRHPGRAGVHPGRRRAAALPTVLGERGATLSGGERHACTRRPRDVRPDAVARR